MTDSFNKYAGQLVADGIDTTAPLIPFDKTGVVTDLRVIDGVMTKVTKMVFNQPKVFKGPLDEIFIKGGMEFGGASEIVSIINSTPNAKQDGTCIPRGQPTITSQLNPANFAYSVDVEIKDKVLSKYVNTAQDLAGFVSMIMETPEKRIASLKYSAQKHMISNVIDGTRAITSTQKSDATGSSVSYASGDITGYAGVVEPVTYGKSEITLANAKDFVSKIEDAYDEMKFENNVYSKFENYDFLMGTPNVIIEQGFLRSLDRVLTGITETHPSSDDSATARLGAIANIVTVDAFDVLPTNTGYATDVLGAVLVDPLIFREDIMYANVESERCVKQRLTGYSYRGESVIYPDRSAPAYAITMSHTA